MTIEISKYLVHRIAFYLYTAVCLWYSNITTAILITPFVVLSGIAVFRRPKAVCLIGKSRDVCLSIMKDVADRLEVEEVHVYEAIDKDDIDPIGIYEDGDIYEFEDE